MITKLMHSQVFNFNTQETLVIIDWDDTLFPTSTQKENVVFIKTIDITVADILSIKPNTIILSDCTN